MRLYGRMPFELVDGRGVALGELFGRFRGTSTLPFQHFSMAFHSLREFPSERFREGGLIQPEAQAGNGASFPSFCLWAARRAGEGIGSHTS